MSWGSTFIPPWRRIDLSAVEAATRHVLAQLPPRKRVSRLEARGPNTVRWFVGVYPDEERRWTVLGVGRADQIVEQYEVAEDESISVEIVFYHDPEIPAGGVARAVNAYGTSGFTTANPSARATVQRLASALTKASSGLARCEASVTASCSASRVRKPRTRPCRTISCCAS
jgi:hypothetical protein